MLINKRKHTYGMISNFTHSYLLIRISYIMTRKIRN